MEITHAAAPVQPLNTPQASSAAEIQVPTEGTQRPPEAFTVSLSPAVARLNAEEPPPQPPEETASSAAETDTARTEELRTEGRAVEEAPTEPLENTPPAGGANQGRPVQPNVAAFQQGAGAAQSTIDVLA